MPFHAGEIDHAGAGLDQDGVDLMVAHQVARALDPALALGEEMGVMSRVMSERSLVSISASSGAGNSVESANTPVPSNTLRRSVRGRAKRGW